jgi:membrane protease subunit HflC
MSTRQNIGLGILLAALLLANSAYVVDQRAVAVLLQFDKYQSTVTEPGLHFKIPFAQGVFKMDKRLITGRANATVPIADQLSVDVDYYAKWRIADVAAYYRNSGGNEQVAGDRLMLGLDGSLREALAGRSLEQLVSGDREQLDEALQKGAQQTAHELGIELVDVRIKTLSLPHDMADAWLERMRAERKRLADDLRARGKEEADQIRAAADSDAQTTQAEAYRKAETLRGEGDGRAAEIYAKVYGEDPEFYAFYRSLHAYREAFQGRRDVLVIEPRGEFFKYFKDAGKEGGGR